MNLTDQRPIWKQILRGILLTPIAIVIVSIITLGMASFIGCFIEQGFEFGMYMSIILTIGGIWLYVKAIDKLSP